MVVVLANKSSRKKVPGVLHTLFKTRIAVAFLLMVSYTLGSILLAAHFDLWQSDFLSVTVIWFITTAVALFFNLSKALSERGYFGRITIESISVPVLVEFLVNLYPFGFVPEVLLQALIIILVVTKAALLSMKQARTRAAVTVSNVLLAGVGLLLLGRGVVLLVASWNPATAADFLPQLLVPVVLTLVLLPFLYLFTLFAAYEQAFTHMRVGTLAGARTWRGKVALILKCGPLLRRVTGLNVRARSAMARASTVRAGMRAFEDGLAADRDARERLAAFEDRLRRFAGVDGVDEAGKRLDQREFSATKDALRYLAMCHMGHYRNRGRKYRTDLLEVLGVDTFVEKGLPPENGFQMRVSKDGQKWWAWRTTVTGWVFGMGAATEPPDEWEYEGSSPPVGPPPAGAGWRNVMTFPDGPTNW